MTYTAEQFRQREAEIVATGAALVGPSLAELLAELPTAQRTEFLDSLSAIDCYRLLYEWEFWARPKQMAPVGVWVVWLILGGRGMGKNRTAAEWIRARIEAGIAKTICFIGPDWKDVRRYMVGGKKGPGGSGILDVWPEYPEGDPRRPVFNETKQEIYFPAYGATIYLNTAEQKELRGANFDTAWADEPIKWKYLETLWHNFEMTLRELLEVEPQAVVTTTPMPIKWLMDLMMDTGTRVTHGETYENQVNVAKTWVETMKRKHEGTRTGDQELRARVLGDNPDALWALTTIETHRVTDEPELVEIGVGVDPAVSEKRKSDETGIVAAGVDKAKELYVLADKSKKYSPEGWAVAAVDLALDVGATFFAVERNKIGDLAAHNIRMELKARGLSRKFEIREAYSMDDKAARATPVANLYTKGRAHHVGRAMTALETEMTDWNPKKRKSPNKIDALVHVAFELCDLAEKEEEKDPVADFSGFKEANDRFRTGAQPTSLGWGGSGRTL